jgi:hypothetical protein
MEVDQKAAGTGRSLGETCTQDLNTGLLLPLVGKPGMS